jgi:hypothetical protein
MTRANGIARCRASASCRTGSINRSRAHHADLALAILSAFVEARRISAPSSRTSVPIVLSAVVGVMRRERPFDTILNHWDETVAYTALFCLVHSFNDFGFGALAPV